MRPFVVFPEGDLFFIMQVCPDALVGGCAQECRCECLQSSDGPLWLFRGYVTSRAEAEARCAALTARFWADVERERLARERAEERRRRAELPPARPVVKARPAYVVRECERGGWSVWRVCSDVLQVGECRDSLWCSCEHSDAGPLRVELDRFALVEHAQEYCRIRQAEFDLDPVAALERVRALPAARGAGDGRPASVRARAAFDAIDPGDVPY